MYLRVKAAGFAESARDLQISAGSSTLVEVRLRAAELLQSIEVPAEDQPVAPGNITLSGARLALLPVDHDQLVNTLQTLASFGGGVPGQARVRVDGFLSSNGAIPPRGSIQQVRINPDLFAAEYEQPPYRGGLIELETRPGSDSWHGHVAGSAEDSVFNARDPFAPTRAPFHSQHFEGSLEAPIVRNRAGLSASLEERSIARFNIVNAILADTSGTDDLHQNVAAPQRFWNGFVQGGYTISPTHTARLSYTAQQNSETNMGAGGFVLPESGENISNLTQEAHLADSMTLSTRTLNELRVGLTLSDAQSAPASSSPSVLVPGFFQAGGSTSQLQSSHNCRLQFEDIATTAAGKHLIRAGVDVRFYQTSLTARDNFNGAYLFGGATAVQLAADGSPLPQLPQVYISGLEQYRRTLLNLAGGQPTDYRVTSGLPSISGHQWRVAGFLQDEIKLSASTLLTLGMRMQGQSIPSSSVSLNPRFGIRQSLDRKHRYVVGAHLGLFEQPTDLSTYLTSLRLDADHQTQQMVYSPSYISPLSQPGSPVISTNRLPLQSLSPAQSMQFQFSTEIALPAHLSFQASWSWTNAWHSLRSKSINPPAITYDASGQAVFGTRPFVPNADLFAYTPDGRLRGHVLFAGLTRADSKRLTTFLGYVNVDFRSNADNADYFPQSGFNDAGEWQRPAWQVSDRAFLVFRYVLPYEVEVSTITTVGSGSTGNIVTGLDNNFDGVFNDRPARLLAPQTSSVTTSAGIFDPTAIDGNAPRNLLTGPYTLQVDGTISRSFALRQRTAYHTGAEPSFAVTARATNLINHQNTTSIEGTLLSPFFGVSNSADPGRRFEFGAAFTF